MQRFRCGHILATAAVALLLTVPVCALAEETAPASSNAADAPATVRTATAATEPVAASAPDASPALNAAPLDPADRAIAQRIAELLAANPNRMFVSENEHAAVAAFYQKRSLAPLWLEKGVENARARAVIARLKEADADGLDPGDYKLPSFAGLAPDALAEAELALTQAVLTYARHVQAGRFPYRLVREDNIGLPQAAPDPAQVMAQVAETADPAKALDEFSPQHEPYRKLKAALAELRGRTVAGRREIGTGPVLAYSRKHPTEDGRVPSLRERLGVAGEASDLRYDSRLADAVKRFQRANGLSASGNLDARTVSKLNHPTHDRRIETVIANMERWRWYRRDLGNAHVEVNEPDFTLKVLHEGRQVWASRIVIGKPNMPTPLLSEKMNSITINPTWHVPPSIVHNEYLPAQARDPGVLSRMGLRLSYKDGEAQITMPPGGQNPLGHIRFNFFNRFMVYQHDTPDQYMFAHEVRAESHGCMRVQDAPKYAEVLSRLAHADEQWTAERVRSMYGSTEQEIDLQAAPVWIHLTYQTAFVDDAGRLQTRRDLYNLDSRTLAAIRGTRVSPEPASKPKREPEVAAPAPAAPVHRRRTVHRAPQVATYPPSMFSRNAVHYPRSRSLRGAYY
jgi:murein L,D-transpeptidase YcbB/YkuD